MAVASARIRAHPRGRGPRTPRGQLNSAPRTRIWRGHILLKILKHKYLMFLRVENAGFTSKRCYGSTLSLQIELFK